MTAVRTAVWSAVLVAGLAMASDVQVDARRVYSAELRDSVLRVPPLLRDRWLEDRRLTSQSDRQYRTPESTGLRLVGKWGRGPSVEVTGQDTLAVLALGSEAALVSVAVPGQLRVLSEIQFDYLAKQVWLRDTLLIAAANGVELWSIAEPAAPRQLSVIPCRVRDLFSRDTLLFLVYADTFRVYSIANPRDPRLLGTCRASGDATAGNESTVALLTTGGLTLVDVRNPQAPSLAATYAGDVWSADIRGNLCCVALSDRNNPSITWTVTLDIANSNAPRQLGRLNNACGEDMQLAGQYCFLSGRSDGEEEFQVVSIADSTSPVLVGTCYVPRANRGVWVNLQRELACVAADPMGLATIDLGSIGSPSLITHTLHADLALDIHVDGNRAYVADYRAGLRILDVTDPARPTELGGRDTTLGATNSATARDSFAYMGWANPPPFLRAVDVSGPTQPREAGGCAVFDWPQDMVLRDSWLYVAQAYRFQVVNVARPREPRLVGSCVLPGDVWDMALEDTLAYVTSTSLVVVNVARPSAPAIVGTWDSRVAVDVRDTIAFTIGRGAVWAMSAADPSQPYVLDTVSIPGWVSDIVLADTVAYAGGQQVYVVDIRDPRNLRIVGSWTPPHEFRRLLYSEPYLYAACYDAGVCILETTLTGVAEPDRGTWPTGRSLGLAPNPTAGKVRLLVRDGNERDARLRVVDVAGREVRAALRKAGDGAYEADVVGLASGVYFLEVKTRKDCARLKFVVQ